MLPSFTLFGLTLYPYSLCMIAGATLCFVLLFVRTLRRYPDVLDENLFAVSAFVVSAAVALPAAMVTDALFKVVERGEFRLDSATFYGGLLCALLLYPVALSLRKDRKVSVYARLCDLAACIPAGHCLGRVGRSVSSFRPARCRMSFTGRRSPSIRRSCTKPLFCSPCFSSCFLRERGRSSRCIWRSMALGVSSSNFSAMTTEVRCSAGHLPHRSFPVSCSLSGRRYSSGASRGEAAPHLRVRAREGKTEEERGRRRTAPLLYICAIFVPHVVCGTKILHFHYILLHLGENFLENFR